MQVVIYSLGDRTDVALSQKLPGGYLLKPVHDSTLVNDSDWDGQRPLVLRFFEGSARSAVIVVVPVQTLAQDQRTAWGTAAALAAGSKPLEIGRFAWQGGSIETGCEAVSMFIRGTRTLTSGDYKSVGGLMVAADAKGLSFFNTGGSPERALRVLVAYSLGLAYYGVLEQAINALAIMTRGKGSRGKEEAMYTEFSRFLASHYFDEPARVTTTEVGPCYAQVRDRLHLRQLRDEVTEQLSRVADIGRIRQQGRITWLGLFVAFVGLLQITQTTPAQVATFARSWRPCIAFWSDARCVPDTPLSVTGASAPDAISVSVSATPLSSEGKTSSVRNAQPKASRND